MPSPPPPPTSPVAAVPQPPLPFLPSLPTSPTSISVSGRTQTPSSFPNQPSFPHPNRSPLPPPTPNLPPLAVSVPLFLTQGCRSSLLAARFASLGGDGEWDRRDATTAPSSVSLRPSVRVVGWGQRQHLRHGDGDRAPLPNHHAAQRQMTPPRWLARVSVSSHTGAAPTSLQHLQ